MILSLLTELVVVVHHSIIIMNDNWRFQHWMERWLATLVLTHINNDRIIGV